MSARTAVIVGIVGVLAAGVFAASRPYYGDGYVTVVSVDNFDGQKVFSHGPAAQWIPLELQASMRPGDEIVFLGNKRTARHDFFDDVEVWLGQEVAMPFYLVSSGQFYQRFRSSEGEEWHEIRHLSQIELFHVQKDGRQAMENALAALKEASR